MRWGQLTSTRTGEGYVDIHMLALLAHSFSGTDIAESCMPASELAIWEAILVEEDRLKRPM